VTSHNVALRGVAAAGEVAIVAQEDGAVF